MTSFTVVLGVKRRLDAKSVSGASKAAKPEAVLQRDDYTCQYCGFRSKKFQRVMPKDWAMAPTPNNMVTACSFCEQCFALETVAGMGSGILTWLPELTQPALNTIARCIYVARAEGGELGDLGVKLFDALMQRRSDVKRRIGTDDPMTLAMVLLENLNDNDYKNRAEKLEGVRLLPLDRRIVSGPHGDTNQFPAMLTYWCSADGPFGQIPSTGWVEMLKTATKQIGQA